MSLEINTSLWPIVITTPRGEVTDADFQRLFATFDVFWKRGEQFVTISDTSVIGTVSAKQRQMVGEWLKQNRASIEKLSIGAVLVVESALMRGAMTAIGWVSQSPLDMTYVKNWEQATDAALGLLEKSYLPTAGLRPRLLEAGRGKRAV